MTKVANLNVDPVSYWLYTSDPMDNLKKKEAIRQYGLTRRTSTSRQEAIRMKHTLFCLSSLFSPPVVPCSPETDRPGSIKYSRKDIIELRCQMRVSTAIVLPTNEQMLDFTTGDKEHWIVNGAQNFCYVHPAKQGARSNLNLICSSGNIYSFVLTEVSTTPLDNRWTTRSSWNLEKSL